MRSALLFGLAGLATLAVGDVTVYVDEVESMPLDTSKSVTQSRDLLIQSCPEEVTSPWEDKDPELQTSSYFNFSLSDTESIPNNTVYPSSGSFVRGAVEAWAQHQNLVLRPDVVWFEILTQLNFYMSIHEGDLVDLFVNSDVKKEIVLKELSWPVIMAEFRDAIKARVKTDWLVDWIKPGFSTTTTNDDLTATALMMGQMQAYFKFAGELVCGLPSVTLMGEKDDWARLLDKLGHLNDFGSEPTAYANNLRPLLTQIVATWDDPDSESIKTFWRQIVRVQKQAACGEPAEYDITGWLTGFLHWTVNGKLRVPDSEARRQRIPTQEGVAVDEVTYDPAPLSELPVGYAKVPFTMIWDWPWATVQLPAILLAGNVGVSRTEVTMKNGKGVRAEPLSAWFLYIHRSSKFTTEDTPGNQSELTGIAEEMGKCDL